MKTYTVQAGDWLSKIASNLGVSVDHLIRMNNITDPNKIFPGQVLKYTPSAYAPASLEPKPFSTGVKVPPTIGIASRAKAFLTKPTGMIVAAAAVAGGLALFMARPKRAGVRANPYYGFKRTRASIAAAAKARRYKWRKPSGPAGTAAKIGRRKYGKTGMKAQAALARKLKKQDKSKFEIHRAKEAQAARLLRMDERDKRALVSRLKGEYARVAAAA